MSENRKPALLELGCILRDAGCAKGYTRAEVAEQVGTMTRFLSAIENGEKRPKNETLREIICGRGISNGQVFYLDLENDTDA